MRKLLIYMMCGLFFYNAQIITSAPAAAIITNEQGYFLLDCFPREELIQTLFDLGETVKVRFLSSDGMIEIFVDEKTGEWTSVLTKPENSQESCELGSGEGWQPLSPLEAPAPYREH